MATAKKNQTASSEIIDVEAVEVVETVKEVQKEEKKEKHYTFSEMFQNRFLKMLTEEFEKAAAEC